MKKASYIEIKTITMAAENLGYNRVLPQQTLSQLDEDGMSVLDIVLMHEHAAGVPVAPHYRCRVMLKLDGKAEPHTVYMDIPIVLYDALQDAVPQSAEVQEMQDR